MYVIGADANSRSTECWSKFLSFHELYLLNESASKVEDEERTVQLLSLQEESEMKFHTQSIVRRVNVKKKKKNVSMRYSKKPFIRHFQRLNVYLVG